MKKTIINQLTTAGAGVITEVMKRVAKDEEVDKDLLGRHIASGKAVICISSDRLCLMLAEDAHVGLD